MPHIRVVKFEDTWTASLKYDPDEIIVTKARTLAAAVDKLATHIRFREEGEK